MFALYLVDNYIRSERLSLCLKRFLEFSSTLTFNRHATTTLTTHARGPGQQTVFGHRTVVHVHRSGAGRSQRHFPGYYGGGQTARASLHHEPSHAPVVAPGPHHEHVRYGRVGDPRFRAVQHVRLGRGIERGPALHFPDVAARVRLGQAKTADRFGRGQTRQVPFLLVVGAVRVDRVHDQRRLNAQRGPT